MIVPYNKKQFNFYYKNNKHMKMMKYKVVMTASVNILLWWELNKDKMKNIGIN